MLEVSGGFCESPSDSVAQASTEWALAASDSPRALRLCGVLTNVCVFATASQARSHGVISSLSTYSSRKLHRRLSIALSRFALSRMRARCSERQRSSRQVPASDTTVAEVETEAEAPAVRCSFSDRLAPEGADAHQRAWAFGLLCSTEVVPATARPKAPDATGAQARLWPLLRGGHTGTAGAPILQALYKVSARGPG